MRGKHGHRKARRDRQDSEAREVAGAAGIPVARAIADTRAGTGLRCRIDDQPILAYKTAHLEVETDGDVHFVGIGHNVPYTADTDAKCNLRYDHAAPAVDCSCGFYARMDGHDTDYWGCGDTVELVVELSGVVIVHERGYRAEHQRVIEVRVPRCECGEQATRFGERPKIEYSPRPIVVGPLRSAPPLIAPPTHPNWQNGRSGIVVMATTSAVQWSGPSFDSMVPRCDWCPLATVHGDLAWLAERLSVPVVAT